MAAVVARLADVAAVRDLERLEARVNTGLNGFFDAGKALKEIRDRSLYHAKENGKFLTFDAYCKGVWQMSPRHAYRLIHSHDTFVAIGKTGPVGHNSDIVITERLLRPLTRLSEPADQIAAWKDANDRAKDEDRPVTARHVSLAVRDFIDASADEPSTFHRVIKPTDNWNFNPIWCSGSQDETGGYGYIPGDLYINCLWYWTKPGQVVAAPMAGRGLIKDAYDLRNKWAIPEPWDLDLRMFDLNPRGKYAHMIQPNDLTVGLPLTRVDYVVMDIPYFGMVHGQYSDKTEDLANMNPDAWSAAIAAIARSCRRAQRAGGLCTVICPNFRQIKTGVILLTTVVIREAFAAAGYVLHDLAYASRYIQQDQSPGMGVKNNMAKRNRTMMTDISEVQTFRVKGSAR